MHLPPAVAHEGRNLEFLWLELTNRCNLQCVHCYTESSPQSGERDLLKTSDYESIMDQAHALGCRNIQFIGGEPQLNHDFLRLVIKAKSIGFEFIEVFSNLTRLSDDTVRYAAENGVRFATSVYSDEPSAHDAITTVKSSHTRTITNLQKLIRNGIETRAAVIVINQDAGMVERTERFLRDLGVRHVGTSEVREFGRGEDILGQPAQKSGLCGHCWNGKLCVAPDGTVAPCVMARQWPVGNVLEAPLAAIVEGEALEHIRQDIYESVWLPSTALLGCTPGCPQSCQPDLSSCSPMSCGPSTCPQSCTPPACPPLYPQ